ncbi:MAG: porin family protein [Flavobacteriaceae bacterium]|jgi:hypothetical protein|nr:porin family protein [Flavobacteriaceae bacterium]
MRRNILTLFLLVISMTSFAQVKFGAKAGMAFGYNGSLRQTVADIKESNARDNIGWHAGFFGRITIINWFIQPEIYFSSMKSSFESSEGSFTAHSNRIDVPVLGGISFLGVGRVYAGPVFSTSLNEGISLKEIRKTETDKFAIAGQLGAGVDIFSLTLDVRYEFGINENQTRFINKHTDTEFELTKRSNSLVASVGYKF